MCIQNKINVNSKWWSMVFGKTTKQLNEQCILSTRARRVLGILVNILFV